jgi:ribosome biogenesis protein Nip4
MKTIAEFIEKFTDKKIGNIEKERGKYYLADHDVSLCAKKIKLPASGIGLFLGSEKNSRFMPSLALLQMLSKISDRKTIINRKQEWFFTNSRDLDVKGKTRFHEGMILVQNQFDENLGLGEFTKKGIKNIIDIGDYLRREI